LHSIVDPKEDAIRKILTVKGEIILGKTIFNKIFIRPIQTRSATVNKK